jgi:hypothetical protein
MSVILLTQQDVEELLDPIAMRSLRGSPTSAPVR